MCTYTLSFLRDYRLVPCSSRPIYTPDVPSPVLGKTDSVLCLLQVPFSSRDPGEEYPRPWRISVCLLSSLFAHTGKYKKLQGHVYWWRSWCDFREMTHGSRYKEWVVVPSHGSSLGPPCPLRPRWFLILKSDGSTRYRYDKTIETDKNDRNGQKWVRFRCLGLIPESFEVFDLETRFCCATDLLPWETTLVKETGKLKGHFSPSRSCRGGRVWSGVRSSFGQSDSFSLSSDNLLGLQCSAGRQRNNTDKKC